MLKATLSEEFIYHNVPNVLSKFMVPKPFPQNLLNHALCHESHFEVLAYDGYKIPM